MIAADGAVKTPLSIDVECHAGYRGEEIPRRFAIGDRKVEVKEVVDRWLAPDHRYFKLISDDDDTYIIRHDQFKHQWELTMFTSSRLDPTSCPPIIP